MYSVFVEQFPVKNDVIFSAHLDRPINSGHIELDGETIVFSGWILPNNGASLTVIIKCHEFEKEVALTLERKDVIQRILRPKEEDLASISTFCGFRIVLPFSERFDVFIKSDSQLFHWKTVKTKKLSEEDIEQMLSLKNCYSDDIFRLKDSFKAKVKLIIPRLVTIRSCKDMIASKLFKPAEIESFSEFMGYINTELFTSDLILSAKKGAIVIKSPVSPEAISGNASYMSGNINCLFLRSETEPFILFQNVTSIDAIYFPVRNVLFIRAHFSVRDLESFFQLPLPDIHFNLSRSLGGVIVSHGRPYHFFYDGLIGLYQAKINQLIDTSVPLIELKGGCYFPLCELVHQNVIRFSSQKINSTAITKSKFYIRLGFFFGGKSKDKNVQEIASKLDRRLINIAREKADIDIHQISRSFPVVWVGVTGQKRSWLEQINGLSDIIKKLYQMYPGMLVIFDGWTSSLDQLEIDKIETKNDNTVINRIIDTLDPAIKHINLAGARSVEKLAYASCVDFFITNHATGSMYVSRMCKKPGITHLSTNWKECDIQHIHYDILRVPEKDITNIVDKNNSRVDFTSYTIDWNVIYSCLETLLSNRSLLTFRNNFPYDE